MGNKNSLSGKFLTILTLLIVTTLPPNPNISVYALQASSTQHVYGWIEIQWGDGIPEMGDASLTLINLTDINGKTYQLDIKEDVLARVGGLIKINRQYMQAEIRSMPLASEKQRSTRYEVVSLSKIPISQQPKVPDISAKVSGSQPWISILCKFNDKLAEPRPLNYFQNMFNSTYPGLDHYWREQSYNQINVLGSSAVGWFTLPYPRSTYIPSGSLDFARAAQDCTAAADAYIDFSRFVGINLMFNDNLDGYAWGGSWCLSLDGLFRCWYMTWEPPWGYADITVIGHEMGHGFGLPHSSGTYGNIYDNQWDVMSDTWTNCYRSESLTYGCLGQHTIAYHKDILGWIPDAKKYIVPYRTSSPHLTNPGDTYLMAEIQLPTYGDNSSNTPDIYTVEVRNSYGYDVKLPGQAVIIHEINEARERPANIVDIDNNFNTGDAGAMWTVGETYTNPVYSFSVAVVAKSGENYQVRIINGSEIDTLWIEPLAQDNGPFQDMGPFYWAYNSIIRLYDSGITAGCTATPLQYCPEAFVTRAQMAVFLERGIHGGGFNPPTASPTFIDDENHWAEDWIEALKSDGLTSGCGNNMYCPESLVTRSQMAVFLLKAIHGVFYVPPTASGTVFIDIPSDYWAAAWIEQLSNEGITSGCGNGNYCPENPISRAQMAVFLANSLNIH